MTAAIGKAIIEVLADASKFESSVEKSGGIKGALSSIGRKVKTGLKVSFAAAGAVAAGALSTALVKGFSRLKAIDDAKAKLKGLGNTSVEISGIMDDALKAVSGTAFGMGEAASTAANLLASGVKPGKELSDTLALVGDTATIAGAGLGEIGGVFQKIKTGNKLTTETLQQLQDKGIPVLKFLADQYGVTQVEAQKMVTAGKVDFASFAKSIKENIGGAALASGESFTGSLKNVGAALGRLGAKLIGGVFDQLPNLFGKAISSLDSLGAGAAKIGEMVGKAFASMVQKITDGLSSVGPAITATKTYISGFAPVFKKAYGQISEAGLDFRSGLSLNKAAQKEFADSLKASPLMNLGAKLRNSFDSAKKLASDTFGAMAKSAGPGLGAAFDSIVKTVKELGPTILTAMKAFSPLGLIFQALKPLLPQIGAMIGSLAGQLGGVLATAFQVVGSVATVIVGALDTLMPIFSQLIASLLPPLTDLLGSLGGMLGDVATIVADVLLQALTALTPVFDAVVGVVAQLLPIIGTLISSLLPPLASLFDAVAPALQSVLGALMPLINALAAILVPIIQNVVMPIIKTLAEYVTRYLGDVIKVFKGVIDFVVGVFTGDWGKAWDGIKAIFSGVWDAIKNVIETVVKLISTILATAWGVIKSAVSTAWNAIKSAIMVPITAAKDAVTVAMNAVASFLSGLWTTITGAVTTAWNGIKTGITTAINGVKTAISTVTGAIGRAWSTFWDGLKKVATKVFDAVAGLAGGIWDGITGGLKSALNGAISLLNGAIGFINSKLIDTANLVPFVNIPHIPSIPKLAEGGPVSAFKPYIVGELGPELIVPRKQGTVIPNDRLGSPQTAANNDDVVVELRALRNDVVTLRAVIAGLPMDAHVLERSA